MIPPLFPRLVLAAWLWILGGLATIAFSALVEPAESREARRELVVTDRYNVPIAELSGLAIARSVEAARGAADMDSIRLYAIGDATYDVASLIINSSSGNASIRLSNAGPVLGKHGGSASQWEAIATDNLDIICMLGEKQSEISCLDLSLRKDLGTFKLDAFRHQGARPRLAGPTQFARRGNDTHEKWPRPGPERETAIHAD